MRKFAFVLLTLAACGKDPAMGGGDDTMNPDGNSGSNLGTPAFELTSPDILLPAGQEFTKCFYFHTPNTATVAINKWVSDMTPGSHHMIMFLTPNVSNPPADGTIDENCGGVGGGGGGTNIPQWTYASATEHYEVDMPSDDGAGKPLAQNIAANSAGYIQMHYLNASDTDKMVHVDLKAYGLDSGAAYTQTDAYVTYVYQFSVPANSTGYQVNATCSTPAGSKFWTVSSHTHKQGKDVTIKDGSSSLYDSTDWEHPMVKNWMAAPYYSFSSGKVSWTCTYDNPGSTAINEGPSAQTNEMCMMTGYYFPASGPKFNVTQNGGTQCLSL
jgi:hypothetical protein